MPEEMDFEDLRIYINCFIFASMIMLLLLILSFRIQSLIVLISMIFIIYLFRILKIFIDTNIYIRFYYSYE
jgi:hypothetical protein